MKGLDANDDYTKWRALRSHQGRHSGEKKCQQIRAHPARAVSEKAFGRPLILIPDSCLEKLVLMFEGLTESGRMEIV